MLLRLPARILGGINVIQSTIKPIQYRGTGQPVSEGGRSRPIPPLPKRPRLLTSPQRGQDGDG